MRRVVLVVVLTAISVAAQQSAEPQQTLQPSEQKVKPAGTVVLPAGTHVPLRLTQAISTKNAKVGDGVYAETTFPIVVDNKMVIPPRTYVQGRITNVKKAGRIKGVAELQIHFTSLIFPSGYTVMLPGSLENAPGLDNANVAGKEGNIKGEGKGGKVAADTATYGATGAVVGGLSDHSLKGAGIGAGVGAAAGLAVATLTRNTDVRMNPGTSLEMVLQRPLELDENMLRNTRQFRESQ